MPAFLQCFQLIFAEKMPVIVHSFHVSISKTSSPISSILLCLLELHRNWHVFSRHSRHENWFKELVRCNATQVMSAVERLHYTCASPSRSEADGSVLGTGARGAQREVVLKEIYMIHVHIYTSSGNIVRLSSWACGRYHVLYFTVRISYQLSSVY